MKPEEIVDDINLYDEQDDSSEPFRASLTNYGADYTIDSIQDRFAKNKLTIPDFQRRYVWSIKDASRFIESLILGLPVPGVFLAQSGKDPLMVIDGQQRLVSIRYFYDEIFCQNDKREVFKLKGVQQELEGLTYSTLSEDDRATLDNSVIHATIIKETPGDDNYESSIYMVFERLNTGGLKLQPQEIRACVYPGEFNRVLGALTENPDWIKIYKKRNPRKKDEELFLRFFAFYYADYNKKGLKLFLNDFMSKNRNLKIFDEEALTNIFASTIRVIANGIGENAFRRGSSINAAIFDSVMYGIAKRIDAGGEINLNQVKERYEALMNDPEFISSTTTDTSSTEAVKIRFQKAKEYFENV